MSLSTVGHGPQDRAALGARLAGADVGVVVDVRRFPASRNNPDVAREALEYWLPERDIGYRWEERLGGRRRLPAGGPVARDWGAGTPVAADPPPPPPPGFHPAPGRGPAP